MPQVKDPSVKDGWYVNMAMNKDQPAPLSLGAVYNFKPGQERFLKAEMILQSRATHQAFTASMANGNLVPKGGKAPEPKKVEVVEEVKVADPVVAEEVVEETEDEDVYSRSDLQTMNKTSLIELAEEMGLDGEGTKAELVDRILVSQE